MQGTRYDVMIIDKSISFMKKFQIKAQSNSRARQLYIYIYTCMMTNRFKPTTNLQCQDEVEEQ